MLKQKIVTGVIRLVNQNQTLFWDDPAPAWGVSHFFVHTHYGFLPVLCKLPSQIFQDTHP